MQLAVISHQGKTRLDSLIRPQDPAKLLRQARNGTGATNIHGISPAMLADAPTFPEVYRQMYSS